MALMVGGMLGTITRVALVAGLGEEMVALAAVNTIAWFLLGLASGRWGHRVAWLRPCLIALGVTGFTSWASLVIQGVSASGQVLIAIIETLIGLMFAGIGHLISMPRGPDL